LAPASQTITYNSLYSTTLRNFRAKLYDQIFNQNVIWALLHDKKRKKVMDGGTEIVIPLEYATNQTVGSIAKWGLIDTSEQDTMTTCRYSWKMLAGSVAIAKQDELINSGKSARLNMLAAKVKNLKSSLAEEVNTQSWALSPGSDDIQSIANIIADAPSGSSTTVGEINQSTYSWWRNRQADSSATDFAGVHKELAAMYNDCSKGTSAVKSGRDVPQLIVADEAAYELYEAMCYAKGRIALTDNNLGNLGFENLKFKKAAMTWDEYTPDSYSQVAGEAAGGSRSYGTYYFINFNYLYMVVHKNCDFVMGPFLEPVKQAGKVAKLLHFMQLCCSNRQKQGVLCKVDLSLTS